MMAISGSVSRQQSTHPGQKHHALCRWILSLYALYLFFMIAGSVCNLVFLCGSPADSISLTDTGNGVKIQLLFGFLRLSEGYLPPDYMNTSAQLLGIPMLLLDLLLEYLPQILICVQLQNIFRKLKTTETPFFPEIVSYISRIASVCCFSVSSVSFCYRRLYFSSRIKHFILAIQYDFRGFSPDVSHCCSQIFSDAAVCFRKNLMKLYKTCPTAGRFPTVFSKTACPQ